MIRRTTWRQAAFALVFLLALGAGGLWLGQLAQAPAALALPYTEKDPNGWLLEQQGSQFSLSRTLEELPEHTGEFTSVRVTLRGQSELTAKLDGTTIFDLPPGERTSGLVTFSLPDGYAGKDFTLSWVQESPIPLYPSVALTTPMQEQTIYSAQASEKAIPAAVSLFLCLLTLGLFCLTAALGNRQAALLLLALGPLSQALYWWAQMPQNAPSTTLEAQLLSLTNQVFFWLPVLFLIFQARRRRSWLIGWGLLAAADLGLSFLLTYGGVWLTGNVPTLLPALVHLPKLLELAGVALVAALSMIERRRENQFFRLYAPALLALGGAALLYVLCFDQRALWLSGPSGLIYLLYWCVQTLALVASLICFIRDSARRDGELLVLSAQEALAREQLAIMEESGQALREQGHETRHHYVALRGLLQEGGQERAAAYLDDLMAQMDTIPKCHYTTHPAVNAILTTMLARAKRQEIQVTTRVFLPESFPVSDADLCTLLMNLLENALEANEQAAAGADKWLRINIHIKNECLFIGIENSRFQPVYYENDLGLCRTTKQGPGHGFGLKAARAVAQKYTGELLLEIPDGSFCVRTVLFFEEQQQKAAQSSAALR